MKITDKFLLAFLGIIPKEKDKFLSKDFDQELNKINITKNSDIYHFLFDKKILSSHESNSLLIKDSGYTIKTAHPQKYIYLTELGQSILSSLQSEFLREEFSKFENELLMPEINEQESE